MNPVQWTAISKKINDKEIEIQFKALIDKGWYVYSQHNNPDGPVPTSIVLNENTTHQLLGKAAENGHKLEVNDPVFGMKVTKFKDEFILVQKVKLSAQEKTLKGYLEYMTCDAEKCLPPDQISFEYDVAQDKLLFGKILESQNVLPVNPNASATDPALVFPLKTTPLDNCGTAAAHTQNSTLWYFVLGFLGGLLALFTPCVFPLLPLTVSFFTRRSKDKASGVRNAFIYSFSIIAIYTLLGFLITLIFGADALNAMASSAFFNILFFVVFVVFAISFFGFFDINMPSWLISKSDERAEKGGLLGIFFMAFTLALVSFSCTGPIIGSVLVEAATTGNTINPILSMLGFSSALALPFGLFAAFPAWLNSLPKSGGWLEAVKKSLGFFELAFALKFLSLVDLAYGKKFLTYELFMGLWFIIFLIWGLYLLGIIKIGDASKPGNVRKALGIFLIVLSFYFLSSLRKDTISGTFHTNALLSGIAPPPGHSWVYPLECAQGFSCIKNDLNAALQRSKIENKPILIDFTGHACVNCRRMEDNVWSNKIVKDIISDKYILLSLYVDEKKALPENEKYMSAVQQKQINTVGAKWADYQITQLKSNAQPLYVLVNTEGQLLVPPRDYTPNVNDYAAWLNCGLKVFHKE